MKRLSLLLILIPLSCFSQNMTKKELTKIIKESIRNDRAKISSYDDLILVADNTDSIFFSANELKIYTNGQSHNFCRRIELKFWNKNFIGFLDCQTCREPSNCYVTTEKKIYTYEVIKNGQELLLEFKNKFENRKYKITDTKRDKAEKILEFKLIRI